MLTIHCVGARDHGGRGEVLSGGVCLRPVLSISILPSDCYEVVESSRNINGLADDKSTVGRGYKPFDVESGPERCVEDARRRAGCELDKAGWCE